ncbi:MAG TPA: hypothetical protein VGM94_00745 [Galbitalea sp.]|jgi:hypothetical protein
MRDETAIPALDLILLTSIRSITAKKPCFHDSGHRARELRDLRKDPPGAFDTKKSVKTAEILATAMKVASPRHRITLPDTSLHDLNDALQRLEADGWIAKASGDAYHYTHGVAKN